MQPELKMKLKLALAGRANVEMGQFQFLNLEEIKQKAGPDWLNLRAKIYDVSAHFIEKRLDPDDVVFRCQGGFLIIFSALSGDAAAQKVTEISTELSAFFLGDQTLKTLKLVGESRSVSAEEFLEIIAQAQPQEAEPNPPTRANAPVDGDPPAWAESEPETVSTPAPPRWTQSATKTHATPWDEIVFKPCWDARNNAVTHHLCVARRVINGWPAYGRDTFTVLDSRPLNRLLDHSVAVAAQRGFQHVHAEGGSCGIIVPVHYDTISSLSERMSYFAILQSVPVPIRRHFQLRIDAIPDGAPVAQMQELFRSMMPFGAKIIARLPYGVSDLRRFEGSGIGIFGTEIPHRLGDGEVSTATIQAVLGLVTSAQNLKADTFLTQIESAALLGASVSAGVRLFSGDLIGPDQPMPAPDQALEFNDIVHRPVSLDDEAHVVHL
ncbi:hypothetical protein [uncultured Maricaulis sp.]|uniref:hypothetical protein n=1 Tax=uncultured Maricaulis sp. TaxID=174710 RepID=UPI0030D7498C|tara:strand:+ start:8190 stop:9500 length:1311 start_codon:yes stop_codon:yes gene_type:complete